MKRLLLFIGLVSLFITHVRAQDFRFAFLTDLHITQSTRGALDDIKRSVEELCAQQDIAFVVISGDITDAGDQRSMEMLKTQLDKLPMPYYITSGNHETTWSESACMAFDRVYGSSRFAFAYQDCFFIGFNSGPFLKMMDGHIAPQDIEWIDATLDSVKQANPKMRIFPVTHYPLKEGDVDNWYELTDVLRKYNIQAVLGGHYHRNLLLSADGMPNVLCRSNLSKKEVAGGYTIISVAQDSIRWSEKRIGEMAEQWLSLPTGQIDYPAEGPEQKPSFEVNNMYPEVHEQWQIHTGVAILEAPAVGKKCLFYGNDQGAFFALDRQTGRTVWMYQTGGRIKSAPAVQNGRVVFGSADGNIYCLSEQSGKLLWKYSTGDVVMGCPVVSEVNGDLAVLIGGSDHIFRSIELKTGKLIWQYTDIKGYVVTRPCVYHNRVYFGAWDCYFYALNLRDGSLAWKWTNGRTDKYSPAAVWPVATDGKIFIVAPDRVFTCLSAATGQEIYRTAEHKVRESIGISSDGKTIFSRCMWDTVVAMDARTDQPVTIWKTDAAYDYDHNPSMMIEKDGVIIFGTKNGLLHAVAARRLSYLGQDVDPGTILWRHKIGNSVLNTICPVSAYECYVTSTDGSITHIYVN